MKINELRYGNWVDVGGYEVPITRINEVTARDSEPIPLTEEWLLKFGFEKFEVLSVDVLDDVNKVISYLDKHGLE